LVFDFTQDEKLIGRLRYKNWFKFNALIELENKTNYQVEPKGFWGTTIELRENEKLILSFQMNWSGEIVIQTFSNDIEKGYIFKHKGIFRESYILVDPDGTELLVVKPHMKWEKMSYEYQVTTSDDFELLPDKEVLLLTTIHCANYYMVMITNVMGG
jgi:hypothetical protein